MAEPSTVPVPLPALVDRRFLRCTTAGATFCLPLSRVVGLRGRDDYEAGAEKGAQVGELLVSGRRIPALRLSSLLGLERRDEGDETFIVLGHGEDAWSLAVDRISKPFPAPAGVRQAFPLLEGRPISPFFTGAAWDGSELVLILEPEGLRAHRAGGPADSAEPSAPPASLHRPTPRRRGDGVRLVLFSTLPATHRSLLFGLALPQVVEVRRTDSVTPIPGAPAAVLGVAPWNRRPLPILDLGLRLGIGPDPAEGGALVVVVRSNDGTAHAGLLAPLGARIRTLSAARTASGVPDDLDPALARAVFEIDDRTLVVPDLGHLLPSPGPSRAHLSTPDSSSEQKGVLR